MEIILNILKFERLRDLHSIGVIHNDIKLDNLLVGGNQDNRGVLHLIDFGLSQCYLNQDGSHIERKFTNSFSGNFIFASVNSFMGYTKSRKDDLESALYLVVFLLNSHYLPWKEICGDRNLSYEERMRKRLSNFMILAFSSLL